MIGPTLSGQASSVSKPKSKSAGLGLSLQTYHEHRRMSEPLLQVENLRKLFPIRRGVFGKTVGHVHAVDSVSLTLNSQRSLGLVGESGCGKTTAARSILRLIEPTSGKIRFNGDDVMAMSGAELRRKRCEMQMIFQDPYGSLNPRLTVGDMLVEPMLVHGVADKSEAQDIALNLLERVGLEKDHMLAYPHQFSGGQRQRIGIARSLALNPKLIVCDEPVSALDVSVQAQVLNLLMDLQAERGIAYLFIAHDLSVVAHFCHDIAVMYLGEIVEMGSVEAVYANPLHPYTQALLSAIPPDEPGEDKHRIILQGDPPSPMEPSSAKRFVQRFPTHAAAFEDGDIALRKVDEQHYVRCAHLDRLQELADRGAAAWQMA